MGGKAEAIAHGAATIVNAIATGKGAAIGVGLWTKAKVELTDQPGVIKGKISSDPLESPILIEKAVHRVLHHFSLQDSFGAKVETRSNIPIARGLKSSSVAANAVTLGTVAALNKKLDDMTIVNLGVDASVDAGVTITGAFDDACASYFGGVVITENLERRIVRRLEPDIEWVALFLVPEKKTYTRDSDVPRMKSVASLVKLAYQEALSGNYLTALSLNGLIYSAVLEQNSSIAIDALKAGALSAGLSGTGPAVTAIVSLRDVDQVKEAWQSYEGEIMQVPVNLESAKVIGRSDW